MWVIHSDDGRMPRGHPTGRALGPLDGIGRSTPIPTVFFVTVVAAASDLIS